MTLLQSCAGQLCQTDRSSGMRALPLVMSDTQGVVSLKTTSIYFLKSFDVTGLHTHWRPCARRTDHQHLKRWSTFCLSSWPLQIMQHKRWNVAAATRTGHAEDSHGSKGGRRCGAPCASPPRCVPSCPSGLWTMSHSGDQHSHLTPGLTWCQTEV